MLAIEHVEMVYPNVAVVGVEGDTVVHGAEDGEVAEFHTLAVADKESEAFHSGVLTYAFDGDVQLAVGFATFDLDALFLAAERIEVGCAHHTDYTNVEWGGHIPLFVCA